MDKKNARASQICNLSQFCDDHGRDRKWWSKFEACQVEKKLSSWKILSRQTLTGFLGNLHKKVTMIKVELSDKFSKASHMKIKDLGMPLEEVVCMATMIPVYTWMLNFLDGREVILQVKFLVQKIYFDSIALYVHHSSNHPY